MRPIRTLNPEARAKVVALLASVPTPHMAPLRGLKHPVRTFEQAMLDLASARSTRD